MARKRLVFSAIMLIFGLVFGASLLAAAPQGAAAHKQGIAVKKQIKKKKIVRKKAYISSVKKYKKVRITQQGRAIIKNIVIPSVAAVPVSIPANIPVPVVPTPNQAESVPVIQDDSMAQQFVHTINAERRANGFPEVRLNETLSRAAADKARDMAEKNYFSHVSPDGRGDFAFIDAVGYYYRAAGSNLAKGNFGSPEGVVKAWMNSSGHRANILADFGQEVGIGYFGEYYVMFIAKPM